MADLLLPAECAACGCCSGSCCVLPPRCSLGPPIPCRGWGHIGDASRATVAEYWRSPRGQQQLPGGIGPDPSTTSISTYPWEVPVGFQALVAGRSLIELSPHCHLLSLTMLLSWGRSSMSEVLWLVATFLLHSLVGWGQLLVSGPCMLSWVDSLPALDLELLPDAPGRLFTWVSSTH